MNFKKLILVFFILLMNNYSWADSSKVQICHITENSENKRTLTVSENAVDAHLNHGDISGECENEGDYEKEKPSKIMIVIVATTITNKGRTQNSKLSGQISLRSFDKNNDVVLDEDESKEEND